MQLPELFAALRAGGCELDEGRAAEAAMRGDFGCRAACAWMRLLAKRAGSARARAVQQRLDLDRQQEDIVLLKPVRANQDGRSRAALRRAAENGPRYLGGGLGYCLAKVIV
jgi:hypothetical protein